MPDRERALAAIVDTFVPGGPVPVSARAREAARRAADPAPAATSSPLPDRLPSGSELGLHRRIVEEVRALGRPDLERQLALLLRVVELPPAGLLLGGRWGAFSRLDRPARESYLRRLATSPVPLKRTAFQDLKRLTMLLAYGIEDSPYRALTGYRPHALDAPSISRVTARTPAPGETIDADAIVIGSGAGGSVAAAVLAAAGKRVVVLEKAAHVLEDRFGGPELQGLADLFLDRGLTATEDRWIAIRAGSAVGGGTIVNWSSSIRAPAVVREEWRAAGIGDDLDEHYAAVEAALGVNVEESERNGPNGRLEAGLTALGLPSGTIPRNVSGCTECGPCSVGCRSGAKRSALRTYLADACRDGAEVLDRTDVRRILVRDGAVSGVLAAVPGGGITVRAPLVALAGGSLHSPAVLLRSRIAERTAGRTLLVHPVAAVVGFYDAPLDPWSGVPMSVMSDAFATIDGREGFRIEAAPTHPGLIASGYPWWSPAQHAEGMAEADRLAPFLVLVRDREPGRVDIRRDGSARIRYAPGRHERAMLVRAQVEMARVHRAAGAGRIQTLHTPPFDWAAGGSFDAFTAEIERRGIEPNRILLFTAHQMASCRIGTARRTSTADPEGRVRGVRGLYVTDASAFPTASGVNPMLSIMALARRTAMGMVD